MQLWQQFKRDGSRPGPDASLNGHHQLAEKPGTDRVDSCKFAGNLGWEGKQSGKQAEIDDCLRWSWRLASLLRSPSLSSSGDRTTKPQHANWQQNGLIGIASSQWSVVICPSSTYPSPGPTTLTGPSIPIISTGAFQQGRGVHGARDWLH